MSCIVTYQIHIQYTKYLHKKGIKLSAKKKKKLFAVSITGVIITINKIRVWSGLFFIRVLIWVTPIALISKRASLYILVHFSSKANSSKFLDL